MLIKSSKISDYEIKKILRYFCEDLDATRTAKLTGINRNTINRHYTLFREKISAYQESINKGMRGRSNLMKAISAAGAKANAVEEQPKFQSSVF